MKAIHLTDAQFEATRWTLVLESKSLDGSGAMNQLLQIYWPPIYAFIRKKGMSPSDAADLTQDFLLDLWNREAFRRVESEKGKLRSFLLACVRNFMMNKHKSEMAAKRGGGKKVISLEVAAEEGRHVNKLKDPSDPEKNYERRWALALIDQTMAKLEQKCAEEQKIELFEKLKPLLTEQVVPGTHSDLAGALAMSEDATRVALHRLRKDFGKLLRTEIAHTLSRPSKNEIEEELRHLAAALGD
jgi:RNA polymerase sigma factor (sigma-70 family)